MSRIKIILLVLILVIIVGINLANFDSEVKNFFYSISSPFQNWLSGISSNLCQWKEAIINFKKLEQENEKLKREILNLTSQNVALQELKKENKVLREGLEMDLQEPFSLVLVQVMEKNASQDFVLINKGKNSNLKEEMPVIDSQKVIWGKISEVYEDFSRVQLISHPESSFSAKVKDKEISGFLKGKGNLKMAFDFVPQEKEINKGDVLVSSVLGNVLPKGLLVGKVKKVEKSDIDPFQKAEIEPFFSIKEEKFLFVITNY